jgi:hypothetical protein
MSAKIPQRFFGYELRPVTEEDLDQARAWTKADPAHDGVIDPKFWVTQGKGVDGYVLSDGDGDILFLQMHRAVRFYIQFSPAATREARERLRKGMIAGMNFLAVALGAVGTTEVVFDTASSILARFVRQNLDFRPAPETLRRGIQTFEPRPRAENGTDGAAQGQTAAVEPIPTTLQGGK